MRFIAACQTAGLPLHYAAHITGHGWRKLLRHPAEHGYRIHTVGEVTPVLKFIQQHAHQDGASAQHLDGHAAGRVEELLIAPAILFVEPFDALLKSLT